MSRITNQPSPILLHNLKRLDSGKFGQALTAGYKVLEIATVIIRSQSHYLSRDLGPLLKCAFYGMILHSNLESGYIYLFSLSLPWRAWFLFWLGEAKILSALASSWM